MTENHTLGGLSNRNVFLMIWGLEVQEQGVNRAVSSLFPGLVDDHLLFVSSHDLPFMCDCLLISSSYEVMLH